MLDLLVNLVFFLLVVRAFLGLQQGSEHDVLECGVLREQIERLEHHAEVQTVLANLCIALGGMVGSVEQCLAVYDDLTLIRGFEKIQAAQQRGLARAGRADDGKRLAALQCKTDVFKHLGRAEVLIKVLYLQNRHNAPPYLK